MRTKSDVENFRFNADNKFVYSCKICDGNDHSCECRKKSKFTTECYEACIPKKLWYKSDEDILYKREFFEGEIKPYVQKLKEMRKHCRGLLFCGPNGIGKTFFASYVLTQAINKNWSTYYTTMIGLEGDIKAGYGNPEAKSRIEYMLTSDFVVIDEVGKERSKESNSFVDSMLEDTIKKRNNDGLPTILITNLDVDHFCGQYGTSIASLLKENFNILEPGFEDLRPKVKEMVDLEINGSSPKPKQKVKVAEQSVNKESDRIKELMKIIEEKNKIIEKQRGIIEELKVASYFEECSRSKYEEVADLNDDDWDEMEKELIG